MIQAQKQQVAEALTRYVNLFASQQDAADSLRDVNAAAISQVVNNHWDMVSNRTWQTIARQVGFYCGEWHTAETGAYMLLRILLADAQHFGMAYGMAIATGIGKTYPAMQYAKENAHTYYIACNELHNRRSFLTRLLQVAGITAKGSLAGMQQQLTAHLLTLDEPLLVFDDAHKLKDRVLHFIVSLANTLAGKCGMVIMGNDELRVRMMEGVRQGKEGYEQVYDSIGRRFVTLGQPGPQDVALVCRANGVTDEAVIAHIKDTCNNNLHQVAGMITQAKMKVAA